MVVKSKKNIGGVVINEKTLWNEAMGGRINKKF
jgi:hypothetical protein